MPGYCFNIQYARLLKVHILKTRTTDFSLVVNRAFLSSYFLSTSNQDNCLGLPLHKYADVGLLAAISTRLGGSPKSKPRLPRQNGRLLLRHAIRYLRRRGRGFRFRCWPYKQKGPMCFKLFSVPYTLPSVVLI